MPSRRSILKDKSRKPPDTDIAQQRLKTWSAEKIPPWVFGIALIILGVMFLPIGSHTLDNANSTYEDKVTYDAGAGYNCYISTSNQGKICQAIFTFSQTVNGPIYLYYELKNYFQNHHRYYQSYSYQQLLGQVVDQSAVSLSCTPLTQNGSLLLNPCGLIANSFFNDVFTIDNSNTTSSSSPFNSLYLDESNIALGCDRHDLYKQVEGFQSAILTSSQRGNSSVTCEHVGLSAGCKDYIDPATDIAYKFYYPDDDTTQYLYETYPNQISPIEGVTNQHFMNWMRTPMFPTFRKLYGSINGTFNNGDQLVITIEANFEVDSFAGEKSLVISTLGSYGGKNEFIGQVYLTVGCVLFVLGAGILIRDKYFRR